MNNIQAGIGDVLLRCPELLEGLSKADNSYLRSLPPKFVALHPFASARNKELPHPDMLLNWLSHCGVPFVILGCESKPKFWPAPPRDSLRLHLEVLRRAAKFIGTLSCFNCAAQIWGVPSFVLVNRSLKEPFVYGLMQENNAIVRAWNEIGSAPNNLHEIYHDVCEWAAS